jgi:peptidoglycan/LPS O-acetylase OafA/YrhL
MAAILWSISVEEQIYFFLPLLIILFLKMKCNLLASSLIFFGITARFLLYNSDQNLYRNTFSYMSTVGIGMLFAIHEAKLKAWVNSKSVMLRLFFLGLVTAYILMFKAFFLGPLSVMAFDLTALMTVILLVICDEKEVAALTRRRKFFGFLGRRTYGMYIFHWPILALLVSKEFFYSNSLGVSLLGLMIALVLTILVSVLSYRYFEKPFLEMRKKYQYVRIG